MRNALAAACSAVPSHDRLRVHPGSRYWRTIREPGDPEAAYWRLYASIEPPAPERLAALLRAVADCQQVGVIIAERQLAWLYHPYDGGANVFPRDLPERDRLRTAHTAWLSTHPHRL